MNFISIGELSVALCGRTGASREPEPPPGPLAGPPAPAGAPPARPAGARPAIIRRQQYRSEGAIRRLERARGAHQAGAARQARA